MLKLISCSGYNALGNQNQTNYDELTYIQNLAPLLAAKGIDAHFIVDQGRSGRQDYTRAGNDWCNNKVRDRHASNRQTIN
jgi:cellulose 1,4-beta-cellobiosidase